MRQAHNLLILLAFLVAACGHPAAAPPPPPVATPWIVSPADARAALAAGATLLDARPAEAYAASHVAGARQVDWQRFAAEGPQQGALHPDDAHLAAVLAGLSVRADRPVRVVGDPTHGWGEDGRLVWTLRTLGHPDAALVDGGHPALVAAGAPLATADAGPIPPGSFTIRRDARWSITTPALQALLAKPGAATLIDAREPREYAGETPYGEARGGHLPGAKPLHFQALLGPTGLKPRAELLALLAAQGATPDRPVVVYCTGGVRSAWLVAVLHDLGFRDARNYAPSMWAWSQGAPADFPLE
ncbi:MAG: rhodanese-like domain-containing protein [bacterium]